MFSVHVTQIWILKMLLFLYNDTNLLLLPQTWIMWLFLMVSLPKGSILTIPHSLKHVCDCLFTCHLATNSNKSVINSSASSVKPERMPLRVNQTPKHSVRSFSYKILPWSDLFPCYLYLKKNVPCLSLWSLHLKHKRSSVIVNQEPLNGNELIDLQLRNSQTSVEWRLHSLD